MSRGWKCRKREDERLGKCPVFEHWLYVGCTAGRERRRRATMEGPGIRARREVSSSSYRGRILESSQWHACPWRMMVKPAVELFLSAGGNGG